MCPSDRRSSSPSLFLRGATTTSEVGCLRPVFDALDADRDGRISHDDLRRAVALVGTTNTTTSVPAPITEADIAPMMAAADADRSGYVEYEEFEQVLLTQTRGHKASAPTAAAATPAAACPPKLGWAREVFRAMDRDGDGVVGPVDLATWLAAAGLPASDEDVRSMIAAAGGAGGGVGFEGMVRVLALDAPAGKLAGAA